MNRIFRPAATKLASFCHVPKRHFLQFMKEEDDSFKADCETLTRKPELVREFISDALYNPNEGYFSKYVNIFEIMEKEGLNFRALNDQQDFQDKLAQLYYNVSGFAC